jgi:hypothetical protein
MTPADEARVIALWNAGTETVEIGRQLGIPRGTVSSRAYTLVRQGKIQARPKGGNYPRSKAQGHSGVEGGPSTIHRPRSTVHPKTWELKQLKHSVRWTVYVPQAMREELQRRAVALGQNPSLLVQEALRRYLTSEE